MLGDFNETRVVRLTWTLLAGDIDKERKLVQLKIIDVTARHVLFQSATKADFNKIKFVSSIRLSCPFEEKANAERVQQQIVNVTERYSPCHR